MDNKLKINIIYNALYQALVILLPILITPYLVRVLSKDQMGINSYNLSIIEIFILISFCGLKNHASREFASIDDKNKRNEEFWSIWIIQIIFSILSFIALNLLIIYIFKENKRIFFIQSFLVLINMMEVSWFFIGIEELKTVVIRNTTIKLLMTALIYIFVKNTNHLYIYIVINIITSFIGNIVLVNSLKQYVGIPNINKYRVIYHLSKSWKFLIPQFSILIYTSLDKVILGNLSNMVEVAYYDQAQKIIRIAISLVSSVGVALLPRMTYLAKNNEEEFDNLLTKTLSNTLLLSIYIVVGVICVSPNFVNWFFSDEYKGIGLLMQIISPIGIFIPIASILWNTVLIPKKLDNIAIKSALYCAIISMALNILLDKYLGALGAVITLLVVEFYAMAYRIFHSRKYYKFKKLIPSVSRYILSGIISCIITIPLNGFMKSNIISTTIIGILCSLLYFFILILMKENLVLSYIRNIQIRMKSKKIKSII